MNIYFIGYYGEFRTIVSESLDRAIQVFIGRQQTIYAHDQDHIGWRFVPGVYVGGYTGKAVPIDHPDNPIKGVLCFMHVLRGKEGKSRYFQRYTIYEHQLEYDRVY